ncbi:MAG TPA: tRNA (guanosine(37)-N1)-methyltransferase TrmD [Candidatus Limadaptatus stercoravium]|nr:tRNA (guanosine(37)-N1)-methyltransferase TrmD [Candidatus Limadaptatus stercoravium]
MKFHFLTVFPEYFGVLDYGIIGRAAREGRFSVNVVNIRDYSTDKHHKTDDYPYGGGAGMVMTPDPIVRATEAADPDHKALRIYMSPKGEPFKQGMAKELAAYDELLFLCGGYEGVDERAIELTVDREISIGDYVLTGGELPALVVMNAVARYIDGVLGSSESTVEESFSSGLLEYPQYTRPQVYRGLSVPDVLVSGNHAEVDAWRARKSLEITKARRPDLLDK